MIFLVKESIAGYNEQILISVYSQGYVYTMNAIIDARYNLGIAYLEDAQYSGAIPEFNTDAESLFQYKKYEDARILFVSLQD